MDLGRLVLLFIIIIITERIFTDLHFFLIIIN